MQPTTMMSKASVFALLLSHASGVTLRRGDPPKPAEIHAKWDKMDDFLEAMFTMACSWKHGKDVSGLAAEKLKNGEVKGAAGYAAHMKETQAKNVKGLEKACGLIVADHKKQCRQGCASRWNSKVEERNGCDKKCVTVYANFETSCMKKAEDLEKVYEQKRSKASGQKQCYEGHCKEFPQVWMKADEKAMKDEVTTQCESRCTDDNVKAGCMKKWALEVDFVSSSIASDCAEKSGVSACFDKKKSTTSADYDKCKSTTKATCEKAHAECTAKGGEKEKAFCDDRKKQCQEQSDEKCLDENKAALAKAKKECEAAGSKEFTKCKEDGLKPKQEAAMKKCLAQRGPTCKTDCAGKCQVEKMNKCLAAHKSDDDPGKMYCKDLWNLLHTSSQVDPVTGNPVVLLSRNSTMAPVI